MTLIPERTPAPRHELGAVGLDPATPKLRRNPDGSIDFAWYTSRARVDRALAVARLFGRMARAVRRGLIEPIREWRARNRALDELAQMDDRMLRDMGLDRGGIYYAIEHGRDADATPANDNAPRKSTAA